MQIRVNRDSFADSVGWVARTISARPNTVALGGVLLETENGKLKLTGSDNETTTKRRIDVTEVVTEGKVLVPGKQLADIARALPNGTVTLTVDGARVKVECGTSTFRIPTLEAGDYPDFGDLPSATGKLAGDVFAAAVTQVAVAASREATIPALTAVKLEAEGGRLTLVATDKYRLAMREITWNPVDENSTQSVLVPRQAVVDAAKSFTEGGDVTLALTPAKDDSVGMVGFGVAGASLSTRQISGEFPKYRGLMPTEFAAEADVRNDVLTEAVKRVALVLRPNVPVKLTFSTEKGIVLEGGTDGGDEAEANEVVPCTYTGDEITIAFNPTYLLDGIGAAGTENVKISLQSGTKPAVISGGGAEGDFRYLLMPVRLTS